LSVINNTVDGSEDKKGIFGSLSWFAVDSSCL
ncbi:hypothetical protein T07_6190, partial [Trichinella nelsoni]